MNIVMSSVDYNAADIELREKISFSKHCMEKIYDKIKLNKDILGTVIISTCNRTEIYISLVDNISINPLESICDITGIDYSIYEHISTTITGESVIWYLSELACGIKSQIWGEDQIITQVRQSIELARDNGAVDSVLEVMFRQAVSAAKKVRTVMELRRGNDNAGKRAVMLITKRLENPKVLVIGNGMAGRDAASQLLKHNIDTTVTLRKYKHSDNIVPYGAKTVDYEEKYSVLESCDAVISATASPHYTLEYDEVCKLRNIPKLFIDLAVPRDIDVKIADIDGVELFDVDDISKNEIEQLHSEQYAEIHRIIKKYADDFYKWYNYKQCMEDKCDNS